MIIKRTEVLRKNKIRFTLTDAECQRLGLHAGLAGRPLQFHLAATLTGMDVDQNQITINEISIVGG